MIKITSPKASQHLSAKSALSKAVLIALVLLVSFSSCTDDPTGQGDVGPDFDRAALLSAMGSQIDESYQSYTSSLSQMMADAESFTTQPSQDGLTALRESWSTALLSWQFVAPYNFGLASDMALEASTNMYPTNVDRIEGNILSDNYTLGAAVNLSASGLPAIDYLIHGLGASELGVIAQYTTDEHSEARGQYLLALCQELLDKSRLVGNTWKTGAAERITFIANDGTDQGSSLGLFLNAFNKSFESSTRTNKLGIPTGALTFSMTPMPMTVEAYYENDNSLAYLNASLDAFEAIYTGAGAADLSLADYLNALDARHGEGTLDHAIRDQIARSREAIALLNDPLSDFVVSDQQLALDAFSEMQALVVLWKVDMMSALSILITYQDTDGD